MICLIHKKQIEGEIKSIKVAIEVDKTGTCKSKKEVIVNLPTCETCFKKFWDDLSNLNLTYKEKNTICNDMKKLAHKKYKMEGK